MYLDSTHYFSFLFNTRLGTFMMIIIVHDYEKKITKICSLLENIRPQLLNELTYNKVECNMCVRRKLTDLEKIFRWY
jgi:hypothetical protein